MLDLKTLLWVVPGVVFIYVYNRRRPNDAISLSGWPYLFSLVITALLFWLPVEILSNDKLDDLGKWCTLVVPIISGFVAFLVALLFTSFVNAKVFSFRYMIFLITVVTFIWFPFHILLIGLKKWQNLMWPLISGVLFFCISPLLKKIFKLIPFNIQDTFLLSCAEWEKKPIILSLQNRKVYVGILLKYPENPRARHESQMISIIPLISGGRNKDTKAVEWGDYYPTDDLKDSELMIPRSEIITFGKFNRKTFEHFKKIKHSKNKE